MELKDCFREDFLLWLASSNNTKIKPYISNNYSDEFLYSKLNEIAEESSQEILDILLKEPLADYFWYTYKEHGSRLTYSIPSPEIQAVPAIREGDALRVDKEKMKVFLRDIKIEKILQ
jgi:hypothetical protein